MRKRTTFFLTFITILLFSTLLPTPPISAVQANSTTWHVPGDFQTIQDAIDASNPGDTILVATGTYYEHLSISKSNLTVIGENPLDTIIDGNQTSSVIFLSAKNVTITGFKIQNGLFGINMVQAKDCTISNNIVTNNTDEGMRIWWEGGNNTITNNTVTFNNNYGIRNMLHSNENTITNNTVTGNKYGISIDNSIYLTLQNNNLTNNFYNFGVRGGYQQEFIHNIEMSNTINGKPIIYLTNQTNLTISPTTYPAIGYLAIVNSNNITIENLNMSNNLQGILLVNSTNSSMKNVSALNNFYGIELVYSDFNNIVGNEIESNQEEQTALHLLRAKFNMITNNQINLNHKGVHLVDYSTNNTIVENTISNNWYGMYIEVFSSGNIIYHNNFISNTEQVSSSWSNNTWDNGYPSGGNYWSDYVGEDQNGDGIGDTPYVIDTYNKDNYPLMNPFEPEIADIAISNVTPAKTVVKQGDSLSINVTIENQSNSAQTFNITLYADQNSTVLRDEILIETRNVTLTGQNSTIIIFTWNTTGVPLANYTINAYAPPLPGEIDTIDNTYINGVVQIAIFFNLTIVATTGGTTDPPPGNYTYPTGTVVNVTAIPNTYWVLDHWELDEVNVSVSNPINITMNADHTLYAVFSIHDVAIINLTLSSERVSPGELVYINVTVENKGNYTETFNLSVYYTRVYDPLIGIQNLTLAPKANKTLTFEWTPNMTGRYEILANTTEIPDEFYTADNTRTAMIYVGYYNGANSQSYSSMTINVFPMAFLSILFAAAMIASEFRKKKSKTDILMVAAKQHPISDTISIWENLVRRQPA